MLTLVLVTKRNKNKITLTSIKLAKQADPSNIVPPSPASKSSVIITSLLQNLKFNSNIGESSSNKFVFAGLVVDSDSDVIMS